MIADDENVRDFEYGTRGAYAAWVERVRSRCRTPRPSNPCRHVAAGRGAPFKQMNTFGSRRFRVAEYSPTHRQSMDVDTLAGRSGTVFAFSGAKPSIMPV